MKKQLLKTSLLILLNIFMLSQLKATTHTVDNNDGSSAQYTDLQAAVDAAQPGDTLLIAGSPTSYSNVTIRKQLVLIGKGYSGSSSKIGNLYFRALTADSDPSGSYVSGVDVSAMHFSIDYLNSANQQSDSLMDFTVERNKIGQIYFYQAGFVHSTFKRFHFQNNLITGIIDFAPNSNSNKNSYQAIDFQNNIFDGAYFRGDVSVATDVNGVEYIHSAESASGFFIRNNIWTSRGSYAFHEVLGAVVENNIFYVVNPIPVDDYTGLDSLEYSLNFNNNITFLTDQDLTANSWFAVGANNQNVDPLFVNFPVDGAAFSPDHDYHLQAGSPAIGAGVNGEDLGIYGGAHPWPGPLLLKPKGPVVSELKPVGSPSVPAGGTVEFQFKSSVTE